MIADGRVSTLRSGARRRSDFGENESEWGMALSVYNDYGIKSLARDFDRDCAIGLPFSEGIATYRSRYTHRQPISHFTETTSARVLDGAGSELAIEIYGEPVKMRISLSNLSGWLMLDTSCGAPHLAAAEEAMRIACESVAGWLLANNSAIYSPFFGRLTRGAQPPGAQPSMPINGTHSNPEEGDGRYGSLVDVNLLGGLPSETYIMDDADLSSFPNQQIHLATQAFYQAIVAPTLDISWRAIGSAIDALPNPPQRTKGHTDRAEILFGPKGRDAYNMRNRYAHNNKKVHPNEPLRLDILNRIAVRIRKESSSVLTPPSAVR